MPEFPVIMSHNILDGGRLAGNEIAGSDHQLERMRDGHRHTWYQAPGTSIQRIEIRAKNFITNPDFEIDTSGWALLLVGGGAGTFARNTAAPLVGGADGLLTATTANDTTNLVVVAQVDPIFMRANRTYRIMIRAKVQDVSQKNIRLGFLKEGPEEDPAFYSIVTVQTTDAGHHVDITPTADGWFHPYLRAIEPQTLQFDDIVAGEIRDIDTLIIDRGHTLSLASIDVDYRNNEKIGYSDVTNPSIVQWTNKDPVYITFDSEQALSWRINISVYTVYSLIEVAKIPIMYLGKRWTLPHHFSGSFDPDQEERIDDLTIGERGVAQRSLKYNQRKFIASLSAIDATNYLDVEKFFEDTENGTKPFFFAWKPTTKLRDILYMRLNGSRIVPYQNGAQRRWEFDAEELAGARII